MNKFFITEYPTPPEEKIKNLEERIDYLENNVLTRIDNLEKKIDKIIESNKNLISYFTEISIRDSRELNYRIRGYPKGKMPPVNFVADKTTRNL